MTFNNSSMYLMSFPNEWFLRPYSGWISHADKLCVVTFIARLDPAMAFKAFEGVPHGGSGKTNTK